MNILNELLNMMLKIEENKRSSSEELIDKIEEQTKFMFNQVYLF